MTEKDAPLEWIFVEEQPGKENLETEDDQVPVIGNDDPTVRTSALPDHGLDSAVHDVSHLLRRAPTADA